MNASAPQPDEDAPAPPDAPPELAPPPVRTQGPRRHGLLPFTLGVVGLALLVGLAAAPKVARSLRLRVAQQGPPSAQLDALDAFLRRYPDDPGGLAALGAIRTWREVGLEHGPPARVEHAASDAPRDQLMLFGGAGAEGRALGDTWTLDGERWSRRNPASQPSARRDHAMAFDAARQRVVLFGGEDARGQPLNDTWEWDGSTWARSPLQGPPARSDHAMCWDAAREVAVLFGGASADGACLADTWTYDGSEWRRLDGIAPAGRQGHALAFDAARAATLLYGGLLCGGTSEQKDGPRLADTWTFDGSGWTLLQLASGPPALSAHGMAFDPRRETVVLFGGLTATGACADATWEWDGERWQRRRPEERPRGRAAAAMTFDPRQGRVVCFGGSAGGEALADMWSYGPASGS